MEDENELYGLESDYLPKMEDKNELYGLESDYLPEEEEDTVAQSPLSMVRQRVLDTISKSEEESRDYQETLKKIEKAKQQLLAAPDKRQVLQGLVGKLTAPRAPNDPRFFERQNLYTFLRDVGEYGQEQREAEKERQAKLVALQELQARYGLERAEKRGNLARQLAVQYLSKEPKEVGETTRTRSLREEAALRGITVPELLRLKDEQARKKDAEDKGLSPSDVRSIRLEVASTLNGPKERLTLLNEGLNNLGLAIKGNTQAEEQLNRALASINGDKQLSLAEVQTVVGAGSFAQRVTNAISKFFTGGAGDLTNEQKKELLETYEAYHAKRYNDARNRLKNIYSGAGFTDLPEDIFEAPYISVAERRRRKAEADAKAKSDAEAAAKGESGSIEVNGKIGRPVN